jgi:hypothetical protein
VVRDRVELPPGAILGAPRSDSTGHGSPGQPSRLRWRPLIGPSAAGADRPVQFAGTSGAEVGEDGEHTPVLGVVGRQAKLGEDAADVLSTALAEITSRWAMAVLEWPSAIRARSCRSRAVSVPRMLSRRCPAERTVRKNASSSELAGTCRARTSRHGGPRPSRSR